MKQPNRLLEISHLTEKHQQLDDKIDLLNKVRTLSLSERNELKRLKVQRLQYRDMLESLRNKLGRV